MVKPKIGFVVYGVHKDGLKDPMGQPFIDDAVVTNAKNALRAAGADLVEEDLVMASRQEARACFSKFKKMDDLDALVLFSGTWVWAAHLVAALRDFSGYRQRHPALDQSRLAGLAAGGRAGHARRAEGSGHPAPLRLRRLDDPQTIDRIVSYCRASHERKSLNMSTAGAFGGRGMGQTCGVADPSQWMKMFGVDIDSRDTTRLAGDRPEDHTGRASTGTEGDPAALLRPIPEGEVADRSIRLYLAIKKMIAKEGWDFYTIQSFPGLGDDYSATCFAQSMMLDRRVGTSTLGDFNTPMTVKLLTELSDEPVYYGDLQHIDKTNQRDQDHRRRRLSAVAGRQARAGQIRRARHPHRGRSRRAVGQAGLQAGRGRAGPPGPRQRRVRDGHHALHGLRAARRISWNSAAWNAASRSGRTPSSPPTAISTSCSKPGTTNTPFSATGRICTTSCWPSAS